MRGSVTFVPSEAFGKIGSLDMDDVTNPTETIEVGPTLAEPKEKKTRGPRKAKAVAGMAAATSVSAPATKARGRRKKTDVSFSPAPIAAAKSGKALPGKRGPRKAGAELVVSDEFADLLKLEDENQKLRKALADKLRIENADLRKKLGRV